MYIIPLFYLYVAIFWYATCSNSVTINKWCLCPIFCEIAPMHHLTQWFREDNNARYVSRDMRERKAKTKMGEAHHRYIRYNDDNSEWRRTAIDFAATYWRGVGFRRTRSSYRRIAPEQISWHCLDSGHNGLSIVAVAVNAHQYMS